MGKQSQVIHKAGPQFSLGLVLCLRKASLIQFFQSFHEDFLRPVVIFPL